MDVEEFYVPDDVLEEASAAKYQMVSTKLKLRYQKELEIFTQWQIEKRIKGKDSFLKTKYRNYQPKKAAAFSRNDVCKFLLEAAKIFILKNGCRSVKI
jgi:hypothetical protein